MNLEKKFQQGQISALDDCVVGYASLFDKVDQQGDMVQRGAFTNSLESRGLDGIKMLWQHDPTKPIGFWTSIVEDAQGLRVEGKILSEIAQGREAIALLKAGVVTGLSIGYRTLKSGNNKSSGRILKSVDLWEISIVTFPMLDGARAELKTPAMSDEVLRDFGRASEELRRALTMKEV